MQHITEGVLQVVAGDIEKLLLEQQEGIAFAYNKISDGIKLTISITMDRTAQGVQVEHALSYPLEARPEPPQKQTVRLKRIISEDQGRLFEAVDNLRPKAGSGIDSVTFSIPGQEPVTLEAR